MALHHLPWTSRTVNNVGRGMTSPPLDCTHGRQSGAWHDITALGQHTRSDDVERGMTSPPLGSTHGRQRQAWHDITTFGQLTRSNDIGRGNPSSPMGSTHGQMTLGVACHHRFWAVHTVERRRDLACHHSPWTAHTVKRCRAWHASIAFGQHTRSNDVGRGMPSSPLGSTHG